MKYLILIASIVVFACQGKLTDEQRTKLKESMKANEIHRFSEAEITEAAFELGREISAIVKEKDPDLSEMDLIDSLQEAYRVKLVALQPGDTLLLSVEAEIIEAYTSTSAEFTPSDNIQKLGPDSLLYTLPIFKTDEQGVLQFKFALGVRMPRKEVVLSLSN